MGSKIKIEFNRQSTFDRLNLKEANQLFTNLVKEKSDPYVPFLTGNLKGTVVTEVNKITYSATKGSGSSYAKKQYYTNKGIGKQGVNVGGKRGPHWDKRMWANDGKEIVKSVADFIGGKVK